MATKKKVKQGPIELDPASPALVVHYTTEVTHLDEDSGSELRQEKIPGKKVIKVGNEVLEREIPVLAKEIVGKCKYIHDSKVADVEKLLGRLAQALQSQAASDSPVSPEAVPSPPAASEKRDTSKRRSKEEKAMRKRSSTKSFEGEAVPSQPVPSRPRAAMLPDASMSSVDEYADQLYEEKMEPKVQGARRLLRLCTDAPNLEALADHELVLGILSRELRDNAKRSHELAIAITCCFLCFSRFSQFHTHLMRHQCGDVTMRVVEYESRRYLLRKQEVQQRRKKEAKEKEGDQVALEREEAKYQQMLRRHDKLMLVCQQILLNLSEDVVIERKVVNRNMIHFLVQLLDRPEEVHADHEELLMGSMSFLKKLSIVQKNKDQMLKEDSIVPLVKLSSHRSAYVALLALRVLFNLSFCKVACNKLIDAGLVDILVGLLRSPPLRQIVLRLLYHLSLEPKCRSLLADHQDCTVLLLQLVVHFPEPVVGQELVALCINLATAPTVAELMIDSGLWPQVVRRAIKAKDTLLFNVVRHVGSHKRSRGRLVQMMQHDSAVTAMWMHDMVRLAASSEEDPDLLYEILGTLAVMESPYVKWQDICETTGLVDLLHRLLVSGFSDDDIVLECVILVGILAQDHECVSTLMGPKLWGVLQSLISSKRDDEEIMVQLVFAFRCLLLHEETRDTLLYDTEIPLGIIELARDRSEAVRVQADEALSEIQMIEIASRQKALWLDRIKMARFESFNFEWCNAVIHGEPQSPLEGTTSPPDPLKSTGRSQLARSSLSMRWTDASALGDVC